MQMLPMGRCGLQVVRVTSNGRRYYYVAGKARWLRRAWSRGYPYPGSLRSCSFHRPDKPGQGRAFDAAIEAKTPPLRQTQLDDGG